MIYSKEKLIRDYKDGNSIKDLCLKYNVSRATIYNWIKNEKKIEDTEITYSDYKKIKIHLERTKREFEIFEALHCFKDASIREKEIAISKFIGVYPIKVMCRLLDLPTGTLYNYHLRRKVITQNQIRDEQLKKEIYKIFKDSGDRFGAKKIWMKLKNDGVGTTLHKVQSIMKLLNIKSTQTIKRKETVKNDNSIYYVNKLKRQFVQDAPNKYWVSDVTEVKVRRSKFYFCVILDLFSRKIVGYRLSSQNNTNLTLNTFKDAYENRNRPKNLSFHSDQGANYTSYEFRDFLHSLKVNQSFSKSGNPYDNACMESFFSTFKREEYNSKHFEFFEELEASVESYVKFYNDYRPHETLKCKTPNQFEVEFYEKSLN